MAKLKLSPIAGEALSRIGALYDIEDRIRGMSADQRCTLRQQHARPILADLNIWIEQTLSTLPQKQKLAEAMRYALSRWVEAELRGLDPEARLAGRQERSAPLVGDMQTWLVHHRAVSRPSPHLAKPWPTLPNTGTA